MCGGGCRRAVGDAYSHLKRSSIYRMLLVSYVVMLGGGLYYTILTGRQYMHAQQHPVIESKVYPLKTASPFDYSRYPEYDVFVCSNAQTQPIDVVFANFTVLSNTNAAHPTPASRVLNLTTCGTESRCYHSRFITENAKAQPNALLVGLKCPEFYDTTACDIQIRVYVLDPYLVASGIGCGPANSLVEYTSLDLDQYLLPTDSFASITSISMSLEPTRHEYGLPDQNGDDSTSHPGAVLFNVNPTAYFDSPYSRQPFPTLDPSHDRGAVLVFGYDQPSMLVFSPRYTMSFIDALGIAAACWSLLHGIAVTLWDQAAARDKAVLAAAAAATAAAANATPANDRSDSAHPTPAPDTALLDPVRHASAAIPYGAASDNAVSARSE